ncbi:MAG: DNA cytosine methyltransferase [Fusobacteriaceae bacterium]
MAKYKFIDLFSGIGGIRIPFEEFGGECVFSSEIDKYAQLAYEANYSHKPQGDITKIKEEDIPKFDLLLAGFPCQAFSNAGKKLGFEDMRGTLFFNVARIIKYHKPKAFLLENVKGLLSHDGGNTFKVIQQTLLDMKYNISYKVLAAKDFGVPQNRQRVYIVGFRKKNDFEFPQPLNKKIIVGDILDEKVDEKYTISDKLWAGHKNRKKKHLENGNGFGYGLVTKDSPYTNTLSARYYKDGSEILIYQGENKNPRKLSPREALRLQGFPEDFKIVVSDVQTYKQAGNSVSVPVIREIAKKMLQNLELLGESK